MPHGGRCPFAVLHAFYFLFTMNTNEVQQVSCGGEFSSTAPFEPLYFMLGIITALLLLNLLKGRYFI